MLSAKIAGSGFSIHNKIYAAKVGAACAAYNPGKPLKLSVKTYNFLSGL